MTKNKQQTAVEWYAGRHYDLECLRDFGAISIVEYYQELTKAVQQAKEMEIAGKEMSYSDGYAEGYKRALDYMTMSIKNAIETK
jgi:hypothetical protein